MIKIMRILCFSLIVLTLSGCRFYYEEKTPQDPLDYSKLTNISYQTVNKEIFQPKCISCHGVSGGVNLESYAEVKKHLSAIERTVIVDKTMPKNGSLSNGQRELLAAWIRAGAPENPEPEPTPEPLKPYFTSIKAKIIDRRCIVCHSTGGAASGVPLGTLKEILDSPRELVLPGNPDESGLIIAVERTDKKRMPPPENGNPLSQEEISVLRKWIENGAPESETSGPNQPNPTPTPSPTPAPLEPTFVSIKQHILTKRCISCHSPGGKASGVPFLTYADLLSSPREIVLPGNVDESGLWIAITRQDDKRMPPTENADPLKADEIEVVRKWIEIGAPEK